MKCTEPGCKANTHVLDTRVTSEGTRRRRECTAGHKFTTVELSVKAAKQYLDLGRLISAVVTGKNAT